MTITLSLKETLFSLPEVYSPSFTLRPQIKTQLTSFSSPPILIILDDDPTGTQTCHDINVLTTWSPSVLTAELASTPPGSGFFILTNSRALHPPEARSLIAQICSNLKLAAKEVDRDFEIVLRSDSTLRGHFPLECEVAEEVLGRADVWILCPFFEQGGRYTVGDVHYVAEGDSLVPVSPSFSSSGRRSL
jgi:uncharacterized protein YgbK (DUF1537 family)